jgi:hypothetical protein
MLLRRPQSVPARLLAIALGLGLALSATACAPGREDKPAKLLAADPNSALGLPKLIGLDPIVKPATKVLDDGDLEHLDSVVLLNEEECLADEPAAACSYRIDFTDLPAVAKVGAVLAAGVSPSTPNGMLVMVDSIDGNTVMATQATLGDALKQGEFLVEKTFSAGDVRYEALGDGVTRVANPAVSGGSRTQPAASVKDAAIDFSYDIDKDIADGVHASGTVGFSIGCGVYGGLTWKKVLGVPVYPNGAYFDARCGASQEGSITISGTAGRSVSEEYEIVTEYMDPITFFIGPVPVVLVPQVVITANAEGTVAAEMSLGASEKFSAVAGISYNDGFSTTKDLSYDFDNSVDTGSARLSLKGGVSAKEALLLYGVAGPRITETLYLDLQGKPIGERPIWCLRGGLSAGVSLTLDLGVKDLEWGPAELFNTDKELGCAENTPPSVSISSPQDGATVYPGTAMSGLTFHGQAYDQEDGGLPLHWSSNVDGDLGTTKPGQDLTLDTLSFGVHTITASATDSDGLTTERSFTVTAKDAAPTVVFLQKDASGEWKQISGISGQKGDIAYFRLSASSVDYFASADCSSVAFTTAMTVTNTSNCDFAINLSQQGSSTLTATVSDTNGKSGTASIGVTVTAPPAVVAPQFSLISAKTTTSPVRTIPDGGSMDWGEQATLKVDYTNAATAGKKVRYAWSMRTTASGFPPGAWTAMGTQDAATTSGSSRSFTAPSAYAKVYTYNFSVVITDAVTGATVATRTFTMTYSGPPA